MGGILKQDGRSTTLRLARLAQPMHKLQVSLVLAIVEGPLLLDDQVW